MSEHPFIPTIYPRYTVLACKKDTFRILVTNLHNPEISQISVLSRKINQQPRGQTFIA